MHSTDFRKTYPSRVALLNPETLRRNQGSGPVLRTRIRQMCISQSVYPEYAAAYQDPSKQDNQAVKFTERVEIGGSCIIAGVEAIKRRSLSLE